jgi:hypothetical protein
MRDEDDDDMNRTYDAMDRIENDRRGDSTADERELQG